MIQFRFSDFFGRAMIRAWSYPEFLVSYPILLVARTPVSIYCIPPVSAKHVSIFRAYSRPFFRYAFFTTKARVTEYRCADVSHPFAFRLS